MASNTDQAPARAADGARPVGELGYEEARDELIRVVGELEQASPSLEHALALWERGEELARRCEEWLVGARARLEAARSAADRAPADRS